MRQWYLDITKYAEEMLEGVEDESKLPGWPKAVRESQKAWIGKERGKQLKGMIGGNKVNVFVKNEEVSKLNHVEYLAISHEIKPE